VFMRVPCICRCGAPAFRGARPAFAPSSAWASTLAAVRACIKGRPASRSGRWLAASARSRSSETPQHPTSRPRNSSEPAQLQRARFELKPKPGARAAPPSTGLLSKPAAPITTAARRSPTTPRYCHPSAAPRTAPTRPRPGPAHTAPSLEQILHIVDHSRPSGADRPRSCKPQPDEDDVETAASPRICWCRCAAAPAWRWFQGSGGWQQLQKVARWPPTQAANGGQACWHWLQGHQGWRRWRRQKMPRAASLPAAAASYISWPPSNLGHGQGSLPDLAWHARPAQAARAKLVLPDIAAGPAWFGVSVGDAEASSSPWLSRE
jgi:hypothetical protein